MNTPSPSGGTQDAPQQNLRPRLAYLLSSYPAISHTFFLNEITELRKLGFTIEVASVNKPAWRSGSTSELETEALETTFYIKSMNPVRVLLVLSKIMFTRPGVVFRGGPVAPNSALALAMIPGSHRYYRQPGLCRR